MSNTFRRKLWLAAVLLLTVSAAFASVCGYVWHQFIRQRSSYVDRVSEDHARLHGSAIDKISADNSQIDMITASINDLRKSMGFSQSPISQFAIAAKYHPIILKAVIPAKQYAYPRSWDDIVFGHVTITTKSRDVIHIAYCNAGKNPLCYSVNGVHYMRKGPYQSVAIGQEQWRIDEGALLYNIIREIHQEQTTNMKSERLTEFIDDLERSIGEKPPKRLNEK